jgi:hypothetical protein
VTKGKPPKDPRGGHVRLYWSMLDSPAWRVLTHADVRIYISMRRHLKGSNNGNIGASLTTLKHAGLTSSSTLSIGLQRLETLGFIEKTRQGGIAFGGKLCSLYRFTDEDTYEIPHVGVAKSRATNAWSKFVTISEARHAIKLINDRRKKSSEGSLIEASCVHRRSG